MTKQLTFKGYDDFDRPVFQDERGRYYCDVVNLFNPAQSIEEMINFYNLAHPSLDDKCGDFESEPNGFNSITDYEVK